MSYLINPFRFGQSDGSPTGLGLGALVSLSANQTGLVDGLIAWDREVYDNGWHSNSVNNTRLTCPTGFSGYVIITCSLYFSASNGASVIEIYKDGSPTFDGACSYANDPNTSDAITSISSGPISATAGNYFEIYSLNGSDTGDDLQANRCFFSIYPIT